jgi:hypothetical protein
MMLYTLFRLLVLNGRMTVNNEVGRMWNEVTMVYLNTLRCLHLEQ